MNLTNAKTELRSSEFLRICNSPSNGCNTTDMLALEAEKSSVTFQCENKLNNEDSNVTETPRINLSGENLNSIAEKSGENESFNLKSSEDNEQKDLTEKSEQNLESGSQKSVEVAEFIKPISNKEIELSEKAESDDISFNSNTENDQDLLQKRIQEKWMDKSCLKEADNFGERKNTFENINDQRPTESQEITLQYLYDTIKCTVGPLFDRIQWITAERKPDKWSNKKEKNFQTVQQRYECTLQEISEVWKNTITLIRSVKDHTLEFLESRDTNVDREQLILEAEMMQLAIDFATNYSKLKSDFLLKKLTKNLNVVPLEKSDLENFLESKTFSAIYSNDDLKAMAQTVEDLTKSVLKGEDLDFE